MSPPPFLGQQRLTTKVENSVDPPDYRLIQALRIDRRYGWQ